MGLEDGDVTKIDLTPTQVEAQVMALKSVFDDKVLRSPVYMDAVTRSMKADIMDLAEGGGIVRFGDDVTVWMVTKGDAPKNMLRGLIKETDAEMLGAQIARENQSGLSDIAFQKEGIPDTAIDTDSNTNTAVSNTIALIDEFSRYLPNGELKVYPAPVAKSAT